MRTYLSVRNRKAMLMVICACLLLFLSACSSTGQVANGTRQIAASPTSTQQNELQIPGHVNPPATPPTVVSTPGRAAKHAATGVSSSPVINNTNHPVLAFYYPWYNSSTWCSCTMSDLPMNPYKSSDDSTIARQVSQAANAGVTGFISSWWGPGDQTDTNFARLLTNAATLEAKTGYHFDSTIYFESDAPALSGMNNMVGTLRYVLSHYSNDPHFFHWHGKPVLFFWDPLGQGRTLSTWATIRQQVDPTNAMIWSAEGVNTSLLSVFDGLHLFSAAYWGIVQGNITTVDQGFRAKIDTYNQAHATQKIWAAGVLPGYDDTRIPGRQGTYVVQRTNGATYRASWTGAISSHPDWITLTSFNEWFEGSMIEPSIHSGTLYLDITQQFSRQWSG